MARCCKVGKGLLDPKRGIGSEDANRGSKKRLEIFTGIYAHRVLLYSALRSDTSPVTA